ncbi:MAG TPA: DUF6178 family protein [Myxococcales bacterium]
MSGALLDLRTTRRALSEARGKQKLEVLLRADALVRSLPAEELYLALLDIGPDDAAEIVAMATPEQFRHFIDMAAWPRSDEGPRRAEVLRWLRLAREGGKAGARFRTQLRTLDVELLALVLRGGMVVHELTEDNQPDPQEPALAFYTPDRRFMLEFSSDYAGMRQLVEDIYTEDPGSAGRLIEAVRWELTTELEDTARRWRDGRLRDVGVPDFEEAVSFYARPKIKKNFFSSAAGDPPAALVAPQRNLIEAALERLSGEDLEEAEESLVYAANAALVANHVPLDDADEVRDQLAEARATLALGLELLSGGDPDRAARVLVDTPIREVFQTAMGEAYRLQTRARKIAVAARMPQAQSATLLDAPLDGVVDALLGPRPFFHQPGQRRPRAFASRADVAAAEGLLEEAEQELALLAALRLSPAVLGPKAEEAGLGPAALKASDAIYALVESQLRNEPFSLKSAAEEPRRKSPGFAEKLDEVVRNATGGSQNATARRLREILAL